MRIDLAATPRLSSLCPKYSPRLFFLRPDLICRLPNCLRDGKPHPTLPFIKSRQKERVDVGCLLIFPCSSYIYLSDLDVSFVKVKCTAGCSVVYHPECYRRIKKMTSSTFCVTPDCDGVVKHVVNH